MNANTETRATKPVDLYDVRTIDVQTLREAYFRETVREARAGARVIVWPEVSGVGGVLRSPRHWRDKSRNYLFNEPSGVTPALIQAAQKQ